MGWIDYYNLYVLYDGKLHQATDEELKIARMRNPNDPQSARTIAWNKYIKDRKLSGCCGAAMVNGGLQCEACGSSGV